MINYIKKVLYVLQGDKKKLLALILTFIGISILEVVGIGLIGPFMTIVSTPETLTTFPMASNLLERMGIVNHSQLILFFGILIIFIFSLKSVLYFLSKRYIQNYAYEQRKLLVIKLLKTYLRIPYTYHLNQNSASLVHSITVETFQFTLKCLIPLLEAIANVSVVIVLLVLLAQVSLPLLIIVGTVILLISTVFNLLGGKFKKWGRISTESNKAIAKTVNHALGGLKETRVIGCEEYFEREIELYGEQFSKASASFQASQILPRIILEATIIIGFVLALIIASLFFEESFESIVSIMSVFLVSAIRLMPAQSQAMQAVGSMRNFSHALNHLYSDLKAIENYSPGMGNVFSKVQENLTLTKPLEIHKGIRIENLSYQYPGSSSCSVKNISIQIPKGQSTAFIGKSGAGKTTLVDIILGLLTPTNGDILVDNTSIYQNLRGYQSLVGYIPQSIFLTDDTVLRNIAFGVPDSDISLERVEAAIKAAQLESTIAGLPDGVYTPVGERGIRLSGGQRQRIGIARAIYHDREILVLDEATSALDTETESLVSDSINALAGSKTLIIISHRLSTIQKCDSVYVLEGGEIIKSGTFREVMAQNLAI